jgi:hypothetical protein
MKEPEENVKGHLIDFGIFRLTNQQQQYAIPDQPGRFAIKANIEFVSRADEIPLKQGIAFGIVWAISGLKEKTIEVVYSVEHPEMTLENGEKSKMATERMTHEVIDGIAGSIDGYVLNHKYELIPGNWKVTIKYKDIEISKTFKVH